MHKNKETTMKKFLFLFFTTLALGARADPTTVFFQLPVSPKHGTVTLLMKQIEWINGTQSKYRVVPEFKPGAGGLIAAKAMEKNPANSIVGVGPHFQKLLLDNKLNEADFKYMPNTGFDMCTGVNTNVGDMSKGVASLEDYRGQELVVGTTANGSPAHLVAKRLSKEYGFSIRLVTFRSDLEAFLNMVAGNGVNFAFASPRHYLLHKKQQPNLKILAVNCPQRVALVPDIKTLDEQGISAPKVFNANLVRKEMPDQMRHDLGNLFQQAANEVGLWSIMPHLIQGGTQEWYDSRVAEQRKWLTRL
jgi:tripartite-type tricarboxylate transporter receptor subunit TctC